MNIALIGYGKMGKAIERIALKRGHNIVSIIDVDNRDDFDSEAFKSADVAIEFSVPASAVDNYMKAFEVGVPVVSGTTAWGKPEDLREAVSRYDATFLWTSNFSVGVNIFFALNRYLSEIMENVPQYTPSMTEIHHIHKLDHPSGTAKTLAQDIIDSVSRINGWKDGETEDNNLGINSLREGEVPGTHIVSWKSNVDEITIEHKALSREGFALGAVLAAEWAKDKKGLLDMQEMLRDTLKF